MVLNINLSNTLKNLWPKIPKKLGFFGFAFYFFFSITKKKKRQNNLWERKGEKKKIKKTTYITYIAKYLVESNSQFKQDDVQNELEINSINL